MSTTEYIPRKEFEERHHKLEDQLGMTTNLAINNQTQLTQLTAVVQRLVEKQSGIDKQIAVTNTYMKIVGPALTLAVGIIGYLLGIKL